MSYNFLLLLILTCISANAMELPQNEVKKEHAEELDSQTLIPIEHAINFASDIAQSALAPLKNDIPDIADIKIKDITDKIYEMADLDAMNIQTQVLENILEDQLQNLVAQTSFKQQLCDQHLRQSNKRKREDESSNTEPNKKQKLDYDEVKALIVKAIPLYDDTSLPEYNALKEIINNFSLEELRNIKDSNGTSVWGTWKYLLPIANRLQKLLEEKVNNEIGETECPICLSSSKEFDSNTAFTFTTFECLHVICKECKKSISKCPICRQEIK